LEGGGRKNGCWVRLGVYIIAITSRGICKMKLENGNKREDCTLYRWEWNKEQLLGYHYIHAPCILPHNLVSQQYLPLNAPYNHQGSQLKLVLLLRKHRLFLRRGAKVVVS
jgi:hypothetical protein